MRLNLNSLALVAVIIAAQSFAAEPDRHAEHHPAPSASAPVAQPKAEASPPAPSVDKPDGMMGHEGMGMMKGMGDDRTMPMQGMTGGSMPIEGHQRMMDHMAAMHGMSPSMMAGNAGARPMWEHVDACIAFLKAELKITAGQEKAWEAFADRLRANAAKMRSLQASMQTGKVVEGPLTQRLDHQEKWFATGYDNIRTLKPVLGRLYGSLSPKQRKVADMIIPPHLDLMQAM